MQNNNKGYLILFIAIVFYYIFYKISGIAIPCMFHKITKLYCPGCGITRMIFSLIRLDFYQAFRYNPLVFILGVLYLIYKIVNIRFRILLPKYMPYILLIIVIMYGIFRNMDLFSYLRPTIIR